MGVQEDFAPLALELLFWEWVFFDYCYVKGAGYILNCVIPITAIGEWQVWASERQMHRDEQEQSLAKTRGYCTGLEKQTSKWNPNKLMNSAL